MVAANVEDVVRLLGDVVDEAKRDRHRRGYFAAMYLAMTRHVRGGIESGVFDDAERMSRLVAGFANRYLDALATFRAGGEPTRSWKAAFQCADRRDRLILQHVILGINAHVNLDLGVAAAEVAPGDAIMALKADFARINGLIGSLLDPVQAAIGKFSPLLDVIWRVSDRPDDEVLNFSFGVAREEAWKRALVLARQPEAERPAVVDSFDRNAALLARLVINPGGILGRAAAVVRHTEREKVAGVIDALAAVRL